MMARSHSSHGLTVLTVSQFSRSHSSHVLPPPPSTLRCTLIILHKKPLHCHQVAVSGIDHEHGSGGGPSTAQLELGAGKPRRKTPKESYCRARGLKSVTQRKFAFLQIAGFQQRIAPFPVKPVYGV